MDSFNINEILHLMLDLKVKKIEVVKELNKRGISCRASRFSEIINENCPAMTEKMQDILINTKKILLDWQAEKQQKGLI